MTVRASLSLLLTALALLAYVLVPAGFMPGLSHGKVALTICHGADIQTIWVDADQSPTEAPAKKAPSCPFAVSASSGGLPGMPAFIVAILSMLAVSVYFVLPPIVARAPLRRGFATRAPPVTA